MKIENKNTKKLLLYSGGFDSVAMLHYLITKEEVSEITVLLENSLNLQGEFELKNARNIIKKFQKKYSTDITLIEKEVDLNGLSKSTAKNQGPEVCLMTHLTTILRVGYYDNVYLGWNKSDLKHLPLSKKIYDWITKNTDYNFIFLEDLFNIEPSLWQKVVVIKYLLENNIFHLPFTSSGHDTIKEFRAREYWFNNNLKEQEVARGLVSIEIFDSLDISNIFKMRTKKEVQDYYNKKLKESERKKNE